MASTVTTKTDLAFQRCVMPDCAATYDVGEVRTSCDACGSLLDVAYDWDSLPVPKSLEDFEAKWSPPPRAALLSAASGGSTSCCRSRRPNKIVTIGEGQTLLQPSDGVASYVGVQPAACSCSTRG